MIVLATDFGLEGPYVGQMKALLVRHAPGVPLIDMVADLPAWDVQAAAYFLAAFAPAFPEDAVFLCVVDPGVGTDARRPAVVIADGRRFVGPNNGLFAILARRAQAVRAEEIVWRPERLSASFHGRDLFAPVAARLALGQSVATDPLPAAALERPGWPDDLDRVIYVDRYGNAMTGRRAETLDASAVLAVGERRVTHARVFAEVPVGGAFWYGNANGLVEIAVNRGRADRALGLGIGDAVRPA